MRVIVDPTFKRPDENPYLRLLYSHMSALGAEVDEVSLGRLLLRKYAIWHRHWPERYLNDASLFKALIKTFVMLILMNFKRWRGTKVVWTIHNYAAHEQLYPQIEKWFWKAFISRIDGYISLSHSGLEVAQERFPQLKKIPGFVIPLGHYLEEYQNEIPEEEARNRLKISTSAKVLLFFGRIRPYKNTLKLIQVFRQYPSQDARLLIVGKPKNPELAEELKTEASLDPRVQLYLNFTPGDQIQVYFRAADIVVLPFREILNSGSALLSLSFNRPVLVPLLGALGELQGEVGKEWLYTYEGEITSQQIDEALEWALNTPRLEKPALEAFDYKKISQRTIDAYYTTIAKSEYRW